MKTDDDPDVRLATNVDRLIDETKRVRKELRDEKYWRRWLLALFGGFAVVAIVGGWYLIDTAHQNKVNGDLIKDCTTPGGECAQRSGEGGVSLSCGIVNEIRASHGLPPVDSITVKDQEVPCP